MAVSTVFSRGWRQLRFDARRYLSAGVALVFGVALFFGTTVATGSIQTRISDRVDSLGGIADAAVISDVYGGTISAGQATEIASMSGVKQIIPTLSRSSVVRSRTGDADITVTGYPAEWNPSLAGLNIEGQLPPAGKLETALTTETADKLGVNIGDQLTVTTTSGVESLRVVGIFDSSAFGIWAYNTMFVDVTVAQRLFDAPQAYSRVDIQLVDPNNVVNWQIDSTSLLPHGVQFQDLSSIAQAFSPLLTAISMVLGLTTLISLVVAALMASATFDSIVRHRTETYATMRAVGASGWWVSSALLTESLVVGVITSALGVLVGLGISWLLLKVLASGGTFPASQLEFGPLPVILSFAVGILATVVGALRPLRRVLRQAPQFTLGAGAIERRSSAVVMWVLGLGLLAAGASTLLTSLAAWWILGVLLLLAAAALLAVLILPWMSQMLSLARKAAISIPSMRVARLRVLGPTTALTCLVICLSVGLLGATAAIGSAMREQVGRQFGADVQVSSSVVVENDLSTLINRVDGVAIVSPLLTGAAKLESTGQPLDVGVLVVDTKTYFETAQLPWVKGSDSQSPKEFSAGGRVFVPAGLAEREQIVTGDVIQLSRDENSVFLKVGGTFASLSTGNQVIIDRQAGDQLGLKGFTGWNVLSSSTISAKDLATSVKDHLSDIPGLAVITSDEMKERSESELGAYTGAVFGVVIVALLLGSVGAAGVFAQSVSVRRTELAVLRAIGMNKSALCMAIQWEALLVGMAASAVGVALGLSASVLLTRVIADALGVLLPVEFSPLAILMVVLVGFVSLLLASLGASRQARNADPVIALRND